MAYIDSLDVDHIESDDRKINLISGDIFEVLASESVDYLLISTRAGNYDPVQGGLVKALAARGVSVEELERYPALDFRPMLPCWVSQPVAGSQSLGFNRLAVFEPNAPDINAPVQAWKAFQALRLFNGAASTASAALPVLSSADGEANFRVMLRMLFFSAASLCARAPWSAINIVVDDDRREEAATEFAILKHRYANPPFSYLRVESRLVSFNKAFPPLAPRCPVTPHACALTKRQRMALNVYTDYAHNFVNGPLRRGDVASPDYAEAHALIEAIGTALSQLRNYTNPIPVNRYLNAFEGIEDLYQEGKVARELAFTSTSSNPDFSWRTDCKLQIKSGIGKGVSAFSSYPEEAEVLFDSDMLHLVTRIEDIIENNHPVRLCHSDETLANTANITFSHL
ncbi:ADP-ribosyltransferase [Pseudomonas akapageensis]|uniref:ADP-ribosyltransferase n=1 Tax=Pseudomonas akapageensis TaxID=2609961 RepID=UPI00140E4E61|nr:ADP-ribosyltransferase [Pseudomonas akapageensis]